MFSASQVARFPGFFDSMALIYAFDCSFDKIFFFFLSRFNQVDGNVQMMRFSSFLLFFLVVISR